MKLALVEKIPLDLPFAGDVRCNVSIHLQEFQGRYGELWFDVIILNLFLEKILSLERTRQGTASLSAMDENEFKCTIFSTDSLGQMAVTVTLRRYLYSSENKYPISLQGCFDIEPENILKSISWCKSVLT